MRKFDLRYFSCVKLEIRKTTTEDFQEFPLFYLVSEEIQQKTEQENSKYISYFEFSCSGIGFPRLQNKRVGISKIFLSFCTLFLPFTLCETSEKICNSTFQNHNFIANTYNFCYTDVCEKTKYLARFFSTSCRKMKISKRLRQIQYHW